MALALSLIALVVGPLLYSFGQRRPLVQQILDGFIFITIAGIVCVHIIPEVLEIAPVYAIVFLALGLLFPILVERLFRHSLRQAHAFILLLAALGLALHATIDGIALLPLSGTANAAAAADSGVLGRLFDNQLALGVIFHRLPVGMAIWWSVRTSFGVPAAVGTLALIGIATAAAYILGQPVSELADMRGISIFQAFVAGSLLHVVTFGVSHDHDDQDTTVFAARDWGYRVGVLIGMVFVGTVPSFFT